MGFVSSMVIAAIAATATGISIAQTRKASKIPEIPQAVTAVPESAKETAAETIAKSQATAQAAAQEQAKAEARSETVFTSPKKAVSRTILRRSRSIFASPFGIAGEAQTIRKTLLGQ